MKKALILIVIIAFVALSLAKNREREHSEVTPLAPTNEMSCFARSVAATADAPFAVEEHMTIHIDGATVTGTKSGTQSGPDVTNGYEGTLSGTKAGDTLSLLFSYTIEGSEQSEQEEYVLTDNALIKHRYPLIERDGILVPDTASTFTEQVYTQVSCQSR